MNNMKNKRQKLHQYGQTNENISLQVVAHLKPNKKKTIFLTVILLFYCSFSKICR